MIINMTGGAGGGLNFKVVRYTATPTGTAAENTIAVVTDTAITSWLMSAEQPTGAEGLVWIETAESSAFEFFADKKQQVKVYPVGVSQYIGDAWAKVDAYIYQNGAWAEFSSTWNGELYVSGNQYESVTGGWSAYAETNGTVTFNTDHIELKTTSSSNSVLFSTNNMIDLSDHDRLIVNIASSTASSFGLWLFVSETKITDNPSNNAIAAVVVRATGESELDISGVNESAYVCFGSIRANAGTWTIPEFRLE